MRIGAALTLIAIGAILKFAINVNNTHGFNINTAGVILMVVGVIGLIIEAFLLTNRRRGSVVYEDPAVRTAPPVERY